MEIGDIVVRKSSGEIGVVTNVETTSGIVTINLKYNGIEDVMPEHLSNFNVIIENHDIKWIDESVKNSNNHKPIVSIDFDGVINSYKSGWNGANVINDDPVPGAIEFIQNIVRDGRFKVCIFSSRNHQDGGVFAMNNWLRKHGCTEETINAIEYPKTKPPSHVLIDDRAYQFNGKFPSIEEIANFKPWNK